MREIKKPLDFDDVVKNYAWLEQKWCRSLSADDRKQYLRLLNHLKRSERVDDLIRVAWWAIMLYESFVFRHPFIVIVLLILLVSFSWFHVCYDKTLVECFWERHELVHFATKEKEAKSDETNE